MPELDSIEFRSPISSFGPIEVRRALGGESIFLLFDAVWQRRLQLVWDFISDLGTIDVIPLADGDSFTPTGETADINTQINTQPVGTLTVNAPTGNPQDGQVIEFVITSTNVQTFAWDPIYAGSTTTPLPVATSGGGLTDKFWFQYNSRSESWEIFNAQFGYA